MTISLQHERLSRIYVNIKENFMPRLKWVYIESVWADPLTICQQQEERISDREKLISEISTQHNIKGYNHTPLEREKVIDFISRLNELQRKQRMEFEKLQVIRSETILQNHH